MANAQGPSPGNPRKFSEKIALLKQRESETNAQFEVAMQLSRHYDANSPECSPQMPMLTQGRDLQSPSSCSRPSSAIPRSLSHHNYLANQRTSSLPNVPGEVGRTNLDLRHALDELQSVSAYVGGGNASSEYSPNSGTGTTFQDARKRLKSQIQSRIPQHQRSVDYPGYHGDSPYGRTTYLPLPGSDPLQFHRRSSSDTAIPNSVSMQQQQQQHYLGHQPEMMGSPCGAVLSPPPLITHSMNHVVEPQSMCPRQESLEMVPNHHKNHVIGGGPTGSLPDLHMTISPPPQIDVKVCHNSATSHQRLSYTGSAPGPAPRKRIHSPVPSPLVIDNSQQSSPVAPYLYGQKSSHTNSPNHRHCRVGVGDPYQTNSRSDSQCRHSVPPQLPSLTRGHIQQVGLCQSSCPTSPLAGVSTPLHPIVMTEFQPSFNQYSGDTENIALQNQSYLHHYNTIQLQRFRMDASSGPQSVDGPQNPHPPPMMNQAAGNSCMMAVLGDNRDISYKGILDSLQSTNVPDIILTEPDVERRDSFTFASEVLDGLAHIKTNMLPPDLPALQISEADLQLLNDPDGLTSIDPATEDEFRLEQQQQQRRI